MFKRKTLFVVGAGASKEVNLPLGVELAQQISERLRVTIRDHRSHPSDELLWDKIKGRDRNGGSHAPASQIIQRGILLANSIDDFLHVHRDNEALVAVGKAVTVRAILRAEKDSDLFVSANDPYSRMNYTKVAGTWFVKLMRVLGPGNTVANASHALSNLSFIVFNYDRCIEHFLTHALQDLFSLPLPNAAEVVRQAEIIHPYGSIGSLQDVPFGAEETRYNDFFGLSAGIRTYTEQIDDQDRVIKLGKAVEEAESIVFLGFAYHDQNMRLLQPNTPLGRRHVFGTAFGMSSSDQENVRASLTRFFPGHSSQIPRTADHIHLENSLKCAELFDYYARSLAG